MRIAGSRILITGASQGIGRALALHFAGRGARVAVTARNEASLFETAWLVETAGGACFAQTSDLCAPETLEALVAAVQKAFGGVDILINNAADVTSKAFLDTSLEEIERLIRTNVAGALQLTRLAAPVMIEAGGGTIVNVSSLAGYKPNVSQTVYSISKAAVNAMSQALRMELGRYGMHVMHVALASVVVEGPVERGRVAVDEVARRVESGLAAGADEVWLSRRSRWLMRVYGGWPRLMGLRNGGGKKR
ncbi:MAG TPA: SDR family oxidoreductase [Candidatus Hydrogenedentes bacterium]|nr:SDR family oxidoreductase [Candidatus Hydrogenedentota bacterium]